jgi:hypothetical protein
MPPAVLAPSALSTSPTSATPTRLPTVSANSVTDLVSGVESLVLQIRELSTRHKAIRRYPELRDLAVTAYQRAQLLKLELARSGAIALAPPDGPSPNGEVGATSDGAGPIRPEGKMSRRDRRRVRRAAKAQRKRVGRPESPAVAAAEPETAKKERRSRRTPQPGPASAPPPAQPGLNGPAGGS